MNSKSESKRTGRKTEVGSFPSTTNAGGTSFFFRIAHFLLPGTVSSLKSHIKVDSSDSGSWSHASESDEPCEM